MSAFMYDSSAVQCDESSKCVLKLVYGADNCFWQQVHGRQQARQVLRRSPVWRHGQTWNWRLQHALLPRRSLRSVACRS